MLFPCAVHFSFSRLNSSDFPALEVAFELLGGLHVLKWIYDKDPSVAVGTDAAYIGGVQFINMALAAVRLSPALFQRRQGSISSKNR